MINIDKIDFAYKKKKLFDSLSLEVKPGLYGLLGRNGAGKSTLLKIICGMSFAQKGSTSVLGFNPTKRLPEMIQKVFYLPEDFNLPGISSKNYLKYNSAFYPNFDADFFYHCASIFELDTEQKLNSLSHGQKKKFIISFGMATQSEVLLLDEPTNGLDIPSKNQFRQLLAKAANEERIIIISTHQVKDVENLINPIIILEEGKIIFNHSVEELANAIQLQLFEENPEGQKGLLYSEKVLGGYAAILEGGNEEGSFDLELLFNAVIKQPSRINQLINGEKND